MKAATANLVLLFQGARQFVIEDMSQWTLVDGTTFNLTTRRGPENANDPIFKRGGVRTQIGIQASSMSIELLCNADSLLANVPAIEFAMDGGLDSADVLCVRYWRATPSSNIAGNTHVFQGRVGEMSFDAAGIHMTAMSDMELLNAQLPRNMFQAACIHDVYNPGCGIVAANFTLNAQASGSGTIYQTPSNVSANTNLYALGVIVFTSGALTGVSRTVKSQTANGIITPVLPWPAAPQSGDQFTIRPGCDKRFVTCEVTFNNTNNFRAYEFIPTPETAY